MYTKFCAFLSRIVLKLACLGLVLIVVCVLYQVFGRYVLNDTPTWAESLALFMVLYVTSFGTAVGVRDAGHIGLESLLVLVPEGIRNKLEMVIHVLVAIFGVCMAYFSATLAFDSMDYNIPTLPIPEGFHYVPLSLCGVFIVLFSIEHLIALVKGEEVVPSWH